ncbi:ABC transporter ATP-binding protein [candidate division WOR-3 bacterium]|nr:ABC transporter ATP-binding protein [candidate division WOR-3 bacterium]
MPEQGRPQVVGVPARTPAAVAARGLTKRFGDVRAVDGLDLEVRAGELFGLLGPNGAGKTTTINLLTGLARPDQGEFSIAGLDCTHRPRAAQHLVGVVLDESNLYPELTGYDNLCFCASLYGIPRRERGARATKLLSDFGLTEAAGRKFAGYSKGMKRKLTIAAGIIHQPSVLFLDEPTTGIDVASARHIRQLIAELHRSGTTILLTTHYIEEAERLCERVAFIVRGRIVRTDTVAALLEPAHERQVLELTVSTSPEAALELLGRVFGEARFSAVADARIRAESVAPLPVGPLVRALEEKGVEVTEARRARPTLEEVFVATTGLEAAALRSEKEKK